MVIKTMKHLKCDEFMRFGTAAKYEPTNGEKGCERE
jgi:hypothetical protein